MWYLTDADFRGTVRVWATGAAEGTKEVKGLSTQGVWRELTIEHVKLAGATMGLYLNVMDGTGKVWFDDVEVVAAMTVRGGGRYSSPRLAGWSVHARVA